MPSTTIAIELTFPSVPEGFAVNVQGLLTWISENAIFNASGAFLTGQIGGSRPVANVGIFVNGTEIEVWEGGTGGKYVPLLTIPIGTMLDYPSPSLVAPDNYVFAEGQSLLIEDYPKLYAVYGRHYCRASDDSNHFRVPDSRGRVVVGAGIGDYDPRQDSAIPDGSMMERSSGEYFGAEFPTYQMATPLGSPTPRYSIGLQGTGKFVWNKTTFNTVIPPSLGSRKIIRAK